MKSEELVKMLDDLDDGQETSEPIARALPGLTLGDVLYLKRLVQRDMIPHNCPECNVPL